MSQTSVRFIALIACLALGSLGRTQTTIGQDISARKPTFVQSEFWSCVLANQATEFRFRDNRSESSQPTEWSLIKDHRTLGAGRAKHTKLDDHNEVAFQIEFDTIKSESVLTVELQLADSDQTQSKTLYVFQENPFEGKQEFLQRACLHLYDPGGETVAVFERMKIPFTRLRSLESIASTATGLIIVGEGIRLSKNRKLIEVLQTTMDNNKSLSVLCLAPTDGTIKFSTLSLDRIELQQATIVRQFDKRLDDRFWSGQSSVLARWSVAQEDGKLSLTPSESQFAWPWVHINFRKPVENENEPATAAPTESTFLVCGLGLVNKFDNGPVPRNALLHIIEKLSNDQLDPNSEKHND